jgi:hypothetical protein
MAKPPMTRLVVLVLKRTAIACALLAATAAQAQQQASCEQNRLQCQKDWAQKNIDGVPVTPPDKTKMCWDGFYACTSAEPPAAQPLAPAPPPTAACEQQRLTCQKTWAQTNSSGVPVTPPDKTKLCWDGYNACVVAGNAKQDAAPKAASLPPMKRFEMRSSGDVSLTYECRIDGTDVRCSGRREKLPPTVTVEMTTTGRISDSVIMGAISWRTHTRADASTSACDIQGESSGPVTVTLRPNGEATIKYGSAQHRSTISGPPGCPRSETQTSPASQSTMSWRVIE